jgi:hypothetical protein
VPTLLSGCAMPGTSSSFLTGMHPSQEFCEARGYVLDAATKQCVPPSQSKPAAAETTGSLPQNPQKPAAPQSASAAPSTAVVTAVPTPSPVSAPPPVERPRAGPLAPLEPDAVIYAELKENVDLMTELTHYVRASGYRCDSVSALAPLTYARGYKFVCNHFNYKYAIEERDGRSIVTVQ